MARDSVRCCRTRGQCARRDDSGNCVAYAEMAERREAVSQRTYLGLLFCNSVGHGLRQCTLVVG